jgi:alkanesulfonate monooxygenase SsuD/methylene tetrahydromethanopterin reductase-like flavin-dependent oxidoreductase (luciferase family)
VGLVDAFSVGVAAICLSGGSRPDDVARACESRGLDLLLFPEHSHVPQGEQLRRPAGPVVGRAYIDMIDALVATAFAFAATDRLRAGPGVAILSQRDPIYFAKEIASLDALSNGRVVVGIGAGWNAMELRNHGVEEALRMQALEAKLRVARGLLSADRTVLRELAAVGPAAESVGDVFGPASVQRPCPPFLVGGTSVAAVKLAARYGLRWMPSCSDLDGLVARLRRVRAGDYGDDARRLSVTVFAAPEHDLLDAMRRLRLDELRALGVDGLVFRLADVGGRSIVDQIDDVAEEMSRAA